MSDERIRHRHRWTAVSYAIETGTVYQCVCGAVKDPAKSKRGTSARRLGHDQERRIERVYGPRKVGEFGDAIDLIGRDFMWQSKSTRLAAPTSSPPDGIWAAKSYAYVHRNIGAMLALRQDKAPLLIRSWVRQGVTPRDLIFVRSIDWWTMHGEHHRDSEYLAMTGAHFLDIHGRDEPKEEAI